MNAKLVLLLTLILAGPSLLGAQTVAEDILKGKEIQGIEFKNYVGPHKVIETRLAIQGIGADLGRQMKVPGALKADYGGKYQILRIHDLTSDKLSADVLVLGPDAGVDHIRNLNWIVSAYLQQAFGYSVVDADLLANFVTRYNAYYRGKLDYVKSVYIPAVGEAVTAENLGLSTTWSDWAGKTRMLIPLRDSLSKGLAGSLNTEEVSNKDIVTQMAQDPGKGLDDRKKLADLKEGEIVQEQKAVAQAEAKTPGVPSGTGTTAVGPTTTNPSPAGSTTAPATNPPTATAGSAATPSPTPTPTALPLDQAKQQLAARDQALQAERQDIVKQETKTPPATPTPTPAPVKPASTAAFVRMNEGSKTGQLWLIDPAANAVWKKSDLNTVRTTDAPAFGTGYLVIAGDTKGANGAVRLVLLSKDDASVLATGADDISPDSPLILSGTQVFALTKGSSGWVLGVFDTTLKAVAKGTDALSPLTAVVPTATGILVQAASGQVLLLDPATLKKKSATGG
jgi:hypothetical protein